MSVFLSSVPPNCTLFPVFVKPLSLVTVDCTDDKGTFFATPVLSNTITRSFVSMLAFSGTCLNLTLPSTSSFWVGEIFVPTPKSPDALKIISSSTVPLVRNPRLDKLLVPSPLYSLTIVDID